MAKPVRTGRRGFESENRKRRAKIEIKMKMEKWRHGSMKAINNAKRGGKLRQ